MSARQKAASRQNEPGRWRRSLLAISAGLAVVLATGETAGVLIARSGEAMVDQVRIDGTFEFLLPEQMSAVMQPVLQARAAEVDLEQLRAVLERIPWVARARVERRWPGGLQVRLWERRAIAQWGESSLLDSEARVFTPAPLPEIPDLPRLLAPAGREQYLLDAYVAANEAWAGSGFELSVLMLDARGEWTGRTRSGLELHFGHPRPTAYTALMQGALARAIEGAAEKVQYVDLRYTNGFSVGWQAADEARSQSGQRGAKHG